MKKASPAGPAQRRKTPTCGNGSTARYKVIHAASRMIANRRFRTLPTTGSSDLLALGIHGRTERIAPGSRRPQHGETPKISGVKRLQFADRNLENPHRLSPAWVLAIIFLPEDRLYSFLAPDFVSRSPRLDKKGAVALFKIPINCFLAFAD